MKKILLTLLLSLTPGLAFADIAPKDVIAQTNAYRVQHQQLTLTENVTLDRAAQLKANDMASKSYFSHTTPTGLDPWYFFGLAGYKYQFAGENLAVQFWDATSTMQAWENSPGHNANLLNARYADTGVAVSWGYYQGRYGYFVVQLFGLKKSTTLAKKI